MNQMHGTETAAMLINGQVIGIDLACKPDSTVVIISTAKGLKFYEGKEAERIIKSIERKKS